MKYWVTPSLAITDDPMEAMDPDEATLRILDGDEAYVSHVRIEDAYTVLDRLGLSQDEIANKIDFALGL